jgi:transposase-like protein
MARRRFWRHPNEFKRMAVERFNNCQSIVALAKELGIQRRLLYKWRLGEREHLRLVLWTVVSQRSIATTPFEQTTESMTGMA